jgi:hypothetical protein
MENRTMSLSLVDALYEIKYNPFTYSKVITRFYANNDTHENLLLLPLIIPLCSHPNLELKKHDSDSTLWTRFPKEQKKSKEQKKTLLDLQERIDFFESLSRQCLDYALMNDWITIDANELKITVLLDQEKVEEHKVAITEKIVKNSENLGKLFSGYSVKNIYQFLGVHPK